MKKQLFILAVEVWARAIITYLFITLIALVIPIMYLISAGLALLWSVPGLFAFYAVLLFLNRSKVEQDSSFYILLCIAPVIAFGCTWLAALHFTNANNTWQEYQEYILFPLAGIASALIAVAVAKARLARGLSGTNIITDEVELLLQRINDNHEN